MFKYLAPLDPQNKTALYSFPFELPGNPKLKCLHAGGTNIAYANKLAKRNVSLAEEREQLDAAALMRNHLQGEREIFPGTVVVGWVGVLNDAGESVPYSDEACRRLLEALPDWIIQNLSNFCGRARNFVSVGEVGTPDAKAVAEAAKN